MRSALALGLVLFSSVASASVKVTEVYKIVGMSQRADSEWTDLQTVTGSVVYVRCGTRQLDDAQRDRVAGFDSEKDCRDFLAKIAKHASPGNPVEVSIRAYLGIEMRVSL